MCMVLCLVFEIGFGYVTQIALELAVTVLSPSETTKCQGHRDSDFVFKSFFVCLFVLDLKIWKVVNLHVGAGDQTCVLSKNKGS